MESKTGWNPDEALTVAPSASQPPPPAYPDGAGHPIGPPPPYLDQQGCPSAPPQYAGMGLPEPCLVVYPPPGNTPSPGAYSSSRAGSPVPPDKFSPLHGQQPVAVTQVLVTQGPLEEPLPDYLYFSIFTIFCCTPLGVAALVYSIFVSMSCFVSLDPV